MRIKNILLANFTQCNDTQSLLALFIILHYNIAVVNIYMIIGSVQIIIQSNIKMAE